MAGGLGPLEVEDDSSPQDFVDSLVEKLNEIKERIRSSKKLEEELDALFEEFLTFVTVTVPENGDEDASSLLAEICEAVDAAPNDALRIVRDLKEEQDKILQLLDITDPVDIRCHLQKTLAAKANLSDCLEEIPNALQQLMDAHADVKLRQALERYADKLKLLDFSSAKPYDVRP
jgi:hypothetical protein